MTFHKEGIISQKAKDVEMALDDIEDDEDMLLGQPLEGYYRWGLSPQQRGAVADHVKEAT